MTQPSKVSVNILKKPFTGVSSHNPQQESARKDTGKTTAGMRGTLIFLITIVIGYLTPGIRGDGHLTRPTATNISITRAGCGATKLCVGAEDCDPAGSVLCPFASSRLVNNSTVDLAIELFGNASGYIALVLSSNVTQGGGTVFVCSRDPFNTTRNFLFRTATQNGTDGNITLVNTPRVDSITYNFNRSINGSFHQCSFTVRNLTQSVSTRSTGLNFQKSIVTGEINADGSFQVPTSRLFRSAGLLNVADPMANIATTASPNTTATTTPPTTTTTTPPTTTTTTLPRPTATNISITRNGCGDTKLCVGGDGCDPAGNVLCPFASSQLVNNSTVDLAVELFGNASGYIALVLSSDVTQGGGTVFVCSRDPFNTNRNFFFRTATQNRRDGNITIVNTPRVDSITYNFNRSINGSFHQCSFTVRNLTQSASTRNTGPMFQPSIVTGEANADGTFQAPTEVFRSPGLLNVADPTANIATTAAPNTTATTTATTAMSGCSSLLHPLTQAIAILVSALALCLF